jgi:hypothetical protein
LVPPWHAIPGDHDFKPRSLDNFYGDLQVRELPYAVEISGSRCIFLDVVSRRSGGPDFRLGAARLLWLRGQLDGARRDGKTAAVFMHAYPADLGEESAEIAAMLDESPVALVSMGHTHYNEVSNDGRTVYAATRRLTSRRTGRWGNSQPAAALAALEPGRNGIFSEPNWDRIGTAGNGDRLLTTILAQRKF